MPLGMEYNVIQMSAAASHDAKIRNAEVCERPSSCALRGIDCLGF